jgi:tetratricopeptide (TPR) repeat protein
MIYFHVQNDDIKFWTDHAHWDAEHGRTKLAIARLDELAGYFSPNPHIEYDRGLLWYHHVGNAKRAREHFLESYRLATEQRVRSTQWFAALYLWKVAGSVDESEQWIDRALAAAARLDPERLALKQYRQWLRQGEYCAVMWFHALGSAEHGNFGTAAAIAEISLAAGVGNPQTEVSRRGTRAEWLRMLDRMEQQQRVTMGEQYPPEERIALAEAVAENERALAADPHDARLWNFRSAWLRSLGKYEEALAAADRALKLRPWGYSRPWMNKATTYFELKRDNEALDCARRALDIATAAGPEFADDIASATRLIGMLGQPRGPVTLADVGPVMLAAAAAAEHTCQLIWGGRDRSAFLARGVRARMRTVGSRQAISYVPLMEQFLSDFCPEVAFRTFRELSPRSASEFERCMSAAMFLAATESGVIQRDAARFLLLVLFSWAVESPEFVRRGYRLTILRLCRSAVPPLSNLDAILRVEMARFHAELPRLICDQEPLTEEERLQGLRILEAHYTRDPREFMMDAPQVGHHVVDPTQSGVVRFVKGLIVGCKSLWLLVSGAGTRRRPWQKRDGQ